MLAESNLKRFAPWAAALGLAGLLAAGLLWLVQRQFNSYVQASLAIGLLGLALALLLNPAAVQTWLAGRQARYGGNVLLMMVALLLILVAVNYLAKQNPKRWDWSEEKLNTLAPESINILKQLGQPARAIGFYSSRSASSEDSARRLLEQYRAEAGGKFDFEFHDPLREPGLARQYNITRDGTLVVEMGGSHEEVTFASEDEITGALVRLSNPTPRTLYFVTGHGEHDLEGGGDDSLTRVADLLKKQNYVLQPLNLRISSTVPSDAHAVIVAGPLSPVTADEVAVIKAYVDQGGKLMVLLDPSLDVFRAAQPGTGADPLADYLRTDWGVDPQNDLVLDPARSSPQSPFIPFAAQLGTSPITERLQQFDIAFPGARSLAVPAAGAGRPELTYTPLAMTSQYGWGETKLEDFQTSSPAQDAADIPGPLNLGVAVENTTTHARLVAYGDSDFASNRVPAELANANLFTNSINWVTVEESLINLTPKFPTNRTLSAVNTVTLSLVGVITVLLLPVLVLAVGTGVWFQRRRHV
jgi:ABC-type uncharacterized transport system involved in gliding motility auxiliary subunit